MDKSDPVFWSATKFELTPPASFWTKKRKTFGEL